MFKNIFHKKSEISNGSDEAMPYSLTIFGLIGGIFILAFLNHLMGMSFGFALIVVAYSPHRIHDAECLGNVQVMVFNLPGLDDEVQYCEIRRSESL